MQQRAVDLLHEDAPEIVRQRFDQRLAKYRRTCEAAAHHSGSQASAAAPD